MSTKTLYYTIGILLLLLISLAFSWWLTASLAGGGIVSALASWLKKDQKFRGEKQKIDDDALKKQNEVDRNEKTLLSLSEKKEKEDNSLIDSKSDASLNDHLDKLAEEFKRNNQ